MRRWWEELLIDFYDRIDGLVAGVHRGRLDRQEHELAVAMTLAKFGDNLARSFQGSSIGELYNATRTMAVGICIDVQRTSIRERAHAAASLDDIRDDPEGKGQAQGWAEVEQAKRAHQRDEERRDAAEFFSWALERLDERQRRVMELSRDGAPVAEITQELGISQANAYQLRSRALKAIGELKEQYDS